MIRQVIKAIMEEIETVDPKLFEELGGKKTADKKEKLHTLKPEEGRTIIIGKHHDLVMEAKEYNKTQDFKDDMKERAHIEPKNAEMRRFNGMARARYWGMSKVNVQFIITAIAVNLKRLANVVGSVCYLKTC